MSGRRSTRRRGPRPSYDLPVLRWIARHRHVTTHQLVARFWSYRGLRAEGGYRRVATLADRGLVHREPLHARGTAARHVLSLTGAGYAHVGVCATPYRGHRPEERRDLDLQFAETLLCLELQAYRYAPATALCAAMKSQQFRRLRHDDASMNDAQMRRLIRRIREIPLPLDGVVGRTGEVRLLVPVAPGISLTRICEHLDQAQLLLNFTDWHLELVGTDSARLDRAARQLRVPGPRFRRTTVHLHRQASFLDRPHPKDIARRGNRFLAIGLPDPMHVEGFDPLPYVRRGARAYTWSVPMHRAAP